MSDRLDVNFDYRRAVLLLKDRINTPFDLQRIWAFCGPFKENFPKGKKDSENS